MNVVARVNDTGIEIPDVPSADSRRDPRFTVLLKAAKLVSPAGEFVCVIRDASVSGLRVQLFHPLPPGKYFDLELPTGEKHRVEVVWERASQAGLRFESRIKLTSLMADCGPFHKRSIRLAVRLPALISRLGETIGVVIHNLSQSGARIECPKHLAIGESLRLEADLLPVLQAHVRWRNGTDYGVVFDQTFRFDELACLVAALQGSGKDGKAGERLRSMHFR